MPTTNSNVRMVGVSIVTYFVMGIITVEMTATKQVVKSSFSQ